MPTVKKPMIDLNISIWDWCQKLLKNWD
jgi:hypothetical protein